MARGEDRRRRFRSGAGGLIAGLALLGVLSTTGGVGRFTERLADLVPGDAVVSVLDAARRGDSRRTTDRLADLVQRVAGGAGGVARELADGAGQPEEGPCPWPAEDAEVTVDIGQHDGWGGHTDERHVGQEEDDLRARLDAEPGLHAASTFSDLETAQRLISAAFACTADAREAWLRQGMPGGRLHCRVEFDRPTGRSMLRGQAGTVPARGIELRLQTAAHSPLGYRLRTAFPEVSAWGSRCGS